DVGGLVRLTATPSNFFPAVDSFQVTAAAPIVALDGFTVDDDSIGASRGNSDGLAEPGERIELGVTLRNAGTDTTGALSGRLAIASGVRLIADLLVDGVRNPRRVILGNGRNHIATLPCTLDVARSPLAEGRPDYVAEGLGD